MSKWKFANLKGIDFYKLITHVCTKFFSVTKQVCWQAICSNLCKSPNYNTIIMVLGIRLVPPLMLVLRLILLVRYVNAGLTSKTSHLNPSNGCKNESNYYLFIYSWWKNVQWSIIGLLIITSQIILWYCTRTLIQYTSDSGHPIFRLNITKWRR